MRQTAAGVWLIIGREVGSDDQKQFRIDRIGRIERTNSFERSNDLAVAEPGSASARQLDHTASDALQIPDGSPTIAEVVTTPEHEDRVTTDLGPATSRPESDSEVALTIPVVNRRLWRQRLYALGTRAHLLGPDELRDEVRAELLQFLPGRRA